MIKRILKWCAGLVLVGFAVLLAWGYAADTNPAAMRAKYANTASQFIDVGGGLTMHVRDEGARDAPVLVLLHGSNASLHTWAPWVARLGDKFRIISVDQIGHGLTGPNPTNDYSAAAFVSTLDAVLQKLNVQKFALAGNSMGGWVAWEYALAHPDKVSQLILIDAGGPPDDPNKKLPIGFRLAQTPGLNKLLNIVTPRSVFEQSLHQSVSNQSIITPEMVDRYWELNRMPGNRNATRLRFANWAARGAHAGQLSSITAPTLIIWGAEDKLIPVAGADWFAQKIPSAEKIIYSSIGHLPMEENAGASARDVAAFLAAHAAVQTTSSLTPSGAAQ